MSTATDNLQAAFKHAMAIRPQVGGFPVLAEVLRAAGVRRNVWSLPSAQSVYETEHGPVVLQGVPLLTGMADVPAFDEAALITCLRADQTGQTTFPQFLEAAWKAGVVRYEVDFAARTVVYEGVQGERYTESYPAVQV